MLRLATALFVLTVNLSRSAGGQTAAAHIDLGDRSHSARDAAGAVAHYEAALAMDSLNYEAAWRAARDAVDLGEFQTDASKRSALYSKAVGFARRAVAMKPRDADGHAQLARAVGRNAMTKGTREKIKDGTEVYEQAQAALAANPKHGAALHVLGVWNAEIMRLNSVSRLIAKTLLGGRVFGEASWENAQRYLEQSAAVEPERIVHHLDLAQVYADRGDAKQARTQYEWILAAPATEANDGHYRQEAEAAVKRLK